MKKIYFVICILFSIGFTSCTFPKCTVDNKLRREIFNECLKNIPKGPERTVTNDWDEVIVECRNTSLILGETCTK
jgi:hypothetical protein